MGASAREIEGQIKETRERMDNNLNELEDRAASNAVRYGRIAAIVVGVVAIGGAGFLLYRRMHRPTLKDRLDDLSIENLRELAEAVSGRLKGQLPSVTVKVNGPTPREPGTIESIVRRVAPAMLGTVSTALLELQKAVHGAKQSAGWLGLRSLGGLLWSAGSIFSTMEFALTQIFGTKQRDMLRQRLMGLVMMLLLVVAIVLTVGLNSVAAFV